MKTSKMSVGMFLILFLILLVPTWKLVNYSYCNWCIDNWLGDCFISYTGRCVEVYSESGFEGFTKYSTNTGYQDFTGQGWHLVLENGKEYYIPMRLEQDAPLCNLDTLRTLESKEVTVVCLPETAIPFFNIIVSLESDGTVYVDEPASYEYLVQSMNAIPRVTGVFLIIISPLILLEILLIIIDICEARNRSKKEKQKQEKMQRLREEGKLHPKKQQQRKQNNVPANKKRS